MIKNEDPDTPGLKSVSSKPILIRKTEAKLKRNGSAKLKVTFSEIMPKKSEKSFKTIAATEEVSPVASNMTIGEFERLVSARLQNFTKRDIPDSAGIRPLSMTRGLKENLMSQKRSIPLTNLLLKEANSEKSGKTFNIRASSRGSLTKDLPFDSQIGTNKTFSLRQNSTNFRPFSQSFRENDTKQFQLVSGFASPSRKPINMINISRFNKTGSSFDINYTTEDLGINPEIEKKNPNLARSLVRLKRIGFPEKNIKALVEFVNKNDLQLIKQVSGVLNSTQKEDLKNIENLIYERKQVENIDNWEKEQRIRFRIRSALLPH